MKKLIIVGVSLLISVITFAQQQTNAERRKMNASILQVIESYESYSSLSNEDAEYFFLNLFKDKNAPVFCDILGNSNFKKQIPVSEYVSYAVKNTQSSHSIIKMVRRGVPEYNNGIWITPVAFQKTYSYIDKNEILFSSKEFFDDKDYEIILSIAYDENEEAYISSIQGSIGSNKTIPEGKYLVVRKNEKQSDELLYNGERLVYNSFDQAFASATGISFSDPDYKIKTDTLASGERYNYVQYSYNPIKWRIRPRFSIAPLSAYKVEFNMDPNTGEAKSSAFEVGVDFGYTFRLGQRAKMALFAGVALSKSKISFSATNIDYEYSYSPSVEKSSVTRKYNILSATEGLKFTDLVVPVYLEGEHRVSRIVSIIWDLGAKVYLNGSIDTKSLPYTVEGSVTFDQTSKSISGSYTQFLNPGSYKRSMLDISAYGGLGCDVNIYDNKFLASIQVGYEMGFSPSFDPGRTAWYIKNERIYPFVYDAKQSNDVAVSSFINSTSYTRSALWFSVGLKMKL